MARASALQVVNDESLAHLKDVQAFAAELPASFLQCRELGHLWRPYRAGLHPDGGYERVLRCGRCRTRREQSLSVMGMVLTNKYVYPDGYQTEHGLGRIVGEGRGMLRLESIKRVLPDAEGFHDVTSIQKKAVSKKATASKKAPAKKGRK